MQWEQFKNQFVLRLNSQEPLVKKLRVFSQERQIGSASIQGIGGLEDISYGIFDAEKGAYSKHQYKEFVELISLSGNITWVENEPFIHCHFLAIGNSNKLIGGHLFEAKASITVELFITAISARIERKYDKCANFKVMELSNTL